MSLTDAETDAETDAGTGPTMGGACHGLLLRLAGQVPDGLLAQAREWLAAGEPETMALAVASHVSAQRLALPAEDIVLLRWILETARLATDALAEIAEAVEEPAVEHAFAPASPAVMEARGLEFGPCLDLAGSDSDLAAYGDASDRAAVATVASVPDAVALWRAWRTPLDGSPWPPPRRVFLLAVADAEQAWSAAAAFQRALASFGERDPQVEAFALNELLPAYQQTARSMAALLWTAAPVSEIRVAPVYDGAPDDTASDGGVPAEPGFAADRPQLADIDRAVIADMLDRGTLLMATTARMDDVLAPDPAAGRARVPVNFRTDGEWVWNDAIAYYVREHGVAPVAGLLAHLRSGPVRQPDAVDLFRATAALTRPR